MKVQVDGDVVAFRAGFGAEHMVYHVCYRDDTFGEDCDIVYRYKKEADEFAAALTARDIVWEIQPERVVEPLSHALANVRSILRNILSELNADASDLHIHLSGPSDLNFRKQLATIKPYKGNRTDSWRPTYEDEIKDYMVRKWGAVYTHGEEADDAMGIAQCAEEFGASVIVTNDKDLDMIPGPHYNFVTGEKYIVDDCTAHWLFCQQLLKGDPTDNILGVPGIGDKKAYAALEDCWNDPRSCLDTCYALYVQSYGWAAWPAFLENGRLLWIRRKPDELWHPITNEYYTRERV